MNGKLSAMFGGVLKTAKRRRKSGIYRSLKDGDLANPIPLDEFFDGLGGIMRLPPRESDPKQEVKVARARTRRNWTRILLPLATVLTIAIILVRRPSEAPSVPLPAGVLGLWSTADKRYANRTFEITNGFVAFKNGDRNDDQTVHPISGVLAQQQGDSTIITVKYLEAGGIYQLSFKYASTPKPWIRFTNQQGLVWSKAARR